MSNRLVSSDCKNRATYSLHHVLLVLFLLMPAHRTAWARQDHDMGTPHRTEASGPIPLYPAEIGALTHPISSRNTQAQAYFNQGFQLMYAFDKEEAGRSFREAEKLDPNCAICYWGEAWSWGAYLNGPMQPREAPHAFAAIQTAVKLALHHANKRERALIHAMSVRYVEHFDSDKRREQDTAYAEAMRKVHERFPKDLDIATLYAEALFLLEPRRGYRDIQAPNVQKIAAILEGVLAVNSRHVGACHLYIHLTEATTMPEKAEACADSIGDEIPGASHINHMPSHTWNRLGRWGDSVRANLEAWHSDQKAAFGQGFAIYPSHNLHMLLFAASMDGQGAIAMQAARDYAGLTHSNMYRILTLIRFGRFDQIAEINKRPDNAIEAGVWDFGQGYAQLRSGNKDAARAYLKTLLTSAGTSKEKFRENSAQNILGTLGGILEGEIDRAEGNLDKAITAFRRAVSFEDAMIFDEPEPLPFSARHWLGAALLQSKQYLEAEQIYRQDLKKHPHNGWSLYGLKAALDGQGKSTTEIDRDFETSWARSDTWIHGSIF